MDTRCAPQRVCCGDLANQCADVGWHSRPPARCRLFQVQNRRKPRRCHAKTVAGCTMWSAERQPSHRCDNQAHSTRSTVVNRSRGRRDRLQRPAGAEARRPPGAAPRVNEQEPERVEQRDNDGHDEPRLFGTVCNLNGHKAYRVVGRHKSRTWATTCRLSGLRNSLVSMT